MKSIPEVSSVDALCCGECALAVVQIFLKLAFVNVAVVVFHGPLLSVSIFEDALEQELVCPFFAVTVPEVVLERTSILTLSGLEIAATVGPPELYLALIEISVFHDEPARTMWNPLNERTLIVTPIRIKILTPSVRLPILNYENTTFHSPMCIIPVFLKQKYPNSSSPLSTV